MKSSDVTITGLGMVSCHGVNLDDQCEAFVEQRCVLREVDRTEGYHRAGCSTTAALVDPACYRPILPPLKARRMSPPSRFGMVAARMALDDAGLGPDALGSAHGDESTAVVFGTSFGPSSYSERILRQIFLESPQVASPMLFTESVANAPASQVALALDCKGPNITVTQREASALLALGEGAALIRSGKVRRALVGGVEELNPLLHAILDRFGALVRPQSSKTGSAGQEERARPFDRRRSGFVAGEGAAVLVLERRGDAEHRGARIRGVVGHIARSFDPSAPVTGWSRGAGLAVQRLEDEWTRHLSSNSFGEDVGCPSAVVAGANGGRAHDRFEASLLKAVSAPSGAPIVTPKAAFGEQGMAVVAGALMLLAGLRPKAPTDFEMDPEVEVVPNQFGTSAESHAKRGSGAAEPVAEQLLLSAASAGGACCWLGLESA